MQWGLSESDSPDADEISSFQDFIKVRMSHKKLSVTKCCNGRLI
jgi:hypothetical protein